METETGTGTLTETEIGSETRTSTETAPPVAEAEVLAADAIAELDSDLAMLRKTQDAPAGPAPVVPTARRWTAAHLALLLAADGLALGMATGLGLLIASPGSAGGLGWLVVPVWLAWLTASGAHDVRHTGAGSTELPRVLGASLRAALTLMFAAYVVPEQAPRSLVLVTLPAAVVLLLLGRAGARIATAAARRRGHGQHRVLVLGTVADVLDLAEQAARTPGAVFDIVGACVPRYDGPDRRRGNSRRGRAADSADGRSEGDRRAESDRRGDPEHLIAVGIPVVGQPYAAAQAVKACAADTVVVAGQALLSRHALRRMAWQFEGTGVQIYFASSLSDVAPPRITFRALGRLPLMHVEAPVFSGGERLLKASSDRVLSLLLAALLSPVLLAIAVLVRLDSPGPALYRQERIGLGGRSFRCLKFRTMRVGADREVATLQSDTDGLLFKMRSDPRVTRVGRVLRRYSLDELPQLFNVLGGSMSLVGPRPPLAREAAEYGHDVRRRLLVKPGMTGLWQVSGRSDLSWAESVRLDLYYVENWSLGFDLQLMARTVVAVAAGRGAY